ncbi:hypothetical protein PYCC9005_001883 [Savitreella phatthalungensis]
MLLGFCLILGSASALSRAVFESELLALHKLLVEHNSISTNEQCIVETLTTQLESFGWSTLQVATLDPQIGPNLLAWPGKSNSTKLLLTSHLDTVPPYIPYSYHPSDRTVWGRGSSDAKASVAAQIQAVRNLLRDRKVDADDIAVLYVSGEEVNGPGMQAVSKLFEAEKRSWPSVVFGEPTEGKIARGHKGLMNFKITANGKASHSGYPWLGSSANEKLVDVLSTLKSHSWHNDTTLGQTTFNIGRMEGGVAANVVPAQAWAVCTVRISGAFNQTLKYLHDTIAEAADISFDLTAASPPTVLDTLANIGLEEIVVNYSTDVPNLSRKVANGLRLLYGPGSILVAHADNEHISVDELTQGVRGYERIIQALLLDDRGAKRDRDRSKEFL